MTVVHRWASSSATPTRWATTSPSPSSAIIHMLTIRIEARSIHTGLHRESSIVHHRYTLVHHPQRARHLRHQRHLVHHHLLQHQRIRHPRRHRIHIHRRHSVHREGRVHHHRHIRRWLMTIGNAVNSLLDVVVSTLVVGEVTMWLTVPRTHTIEKAS